MPEIATCALTGPNEDGRTRRAVGRGVQAEEEVEPYDIEEVQRLPSEAAKLRNSVRWSEKWPRSLTRAARRARKRQASGRAEARQ